MIICVTGEIASGKNTVCRVLCEKGSVMAVDADECVHRAIDECQDKILATFLPAASKAHITLLAPSGKIDRKALARLLFSHPQLLKEQEAIVYPLVIRDYEKLIKLNQKPTFVINATLLYKIPSLLARCSKVIFVKAPLFTRIARICKRDKCNVFSALRRIQLQRGLLKSYERVISSFEKIIPIEIIDNDDTIEALREYFYPIAQYKGTKPL